MNQNKQNIIKLLMLKLNYNAFLFKHRNLSKLQFHFLPFLPPAAACAAAYSASASESKIFKSSLIGSSLWSSWIPTVTSVITISYVPAVN